MITATTLTTPSPVLAIVAPASLGDGFALSLAGLLDAAAGTTFKPASDGEGGHDHAGPGNELPEDGDVAPDALAWLCGPMAIIPPSRPIAFKPVPVSTPALGRARPEPLEASVGAVGEGMLPFARFSFLTPTLDSSPAALAASFPDNLPVLPNANAAVPAASPIGAADVPSIHALTVATPPRAGAPQSRLGAAPPSPAPAQIDQVGSLARLLAGAATIVSEAPDRSLAAEPGAVATGSPDHAAKEAPSLIASPVTIASPKVGAVGQVLPALAITISPTIGPVSRNAAQPDIASSIVTDPTGPMVTAIAEAPRPVVAVADAQSVPLDLGDHQWPERMIDRIEMLRDAADADDASIRLIPDALGAIDVLVEREGDTVNVHFAAEQAATRALLQEAQPRLAELADARGLKLGQSSVGTGEGGGRQPTPTPQPVAASGRAGDDADLTIDDDRIA